MLVESVHNKLNYLVVSPWYFDALSEIKSSLLSLHLMDKFILLHNSVNINICMLILWVNPDSKVHGANMGPTWVLSAPDGPHVSPMNFAIRESTEILCTTMCWQQDIKITWDIWPISADDQSHGLSQKDCNHLAPNLGCRHTDCAMNLRQSPCWMTHSIGRRQLQY